MKRLLSLTRDLVLIKIEKYSMEFSLEVDRRQRRIFTSDNINAGPEHHECSTTEVLYIQLMCSLIRILNFVSFFFNVPMTTFKKNIINTPNDSAQK